MVAWLGRAPLAFPPMPDFGTGATAIRTRHRAPLYVRSSRVPRLSSADARVPTPSSIGRQGFLAMAVGATGAAFLLAAVKENLSNILV